MELTKIEWENLIVRPNPEVNSSLIATGETGGIRSYHYRNPEGVQLDRIVNFNERRYVTNFVYLMYRSILHIAPFGLHTIRQRRDFPTLVSLKQCESIHTAMRKLVVDPKIVETPNHGYPIMDLYFNPILKEAFSNNPFFVKLETFRGATACTDLGVLLLNKKIARVVQEQTTKRRGVTFLKGLEELLRDCQHFSFFVLRTDTHGK